MTPSRSLFFFCSVFSAVPDNVIRAGSTGLQLTAIPDYPVPAGQNVSLYCSAPNWPALKKWYWQRQEKEAWEEVAKGGNLTLTGPQQSGVYRCLAQSNQSERVSPSHAVYIISNCPTENVGIIALALSLLALIMNIAVIFWFSWQRFKDKGSPPNIGAKGFPRAGKEPKGGLPLAENAGHVYVNYSSTNLAYTDLDSTSVTPESTYSVLNQ
ncbi:uncharacterized protein LOC133513155 [Syngnathoides biaculeatus]|uniref:uncharacterized protein LOC133513155 n=1 Tax=Syngnathoides biaculeatus TaxID=300417 RepID=UPI002ADE5EE1|nr:uncharacterized protein LOC133513155 [Syngnathoides biaculeatus]